MSRSHHALNPDFWTKSARQALSLLRNRDRPVLIGEISLHLALSLNQTESLLDSLADKGLVMRATSADLASKNAFVLVNPQLVPMGDYEQVPLAILGSPPGT